MAVIETIEIGETMFFIQMNLVIEQPQKRPFTPIDSIHAHAAVMHAISAVNNSLGATLHDIGRNKPLGLALVNNQLRLNWFGPTSLAYMQALLAYWQAAPRFRIGEKMFSFTHIGLNSGKHQQVQTWSDLTVPAKHPRIQIEFLTPTAVTRQDKQRKRYTALHPDPLTIFTLLARRWQDLGGPPLPDHLADYLADGGCVTKAYNLSTAEFTHRRRVQLGFVGRVAYICRQPHPECVQALNWLARLAPFSGIGYQTTRGMGAVATHFLE
jgi:CRISPR-associated endoribonuclease Cas6